METICSVSKKLNTISIFSSGCLRKVCYIFYHKTSAGLLGMTMRLGHSEPLSLSKVQERGTESLPLRLGNFNL